MNETVSELRERSDKAATDEMMVRTEEPQIPADIYYGKYNDAAEIIHQQTIADLELRRSMCDGR